MALGQMHRHRKKFIPAKLQITSMMDMFTIILIFLLFSFSDEPEAHYPEKDINLPESSSTLKYEDNVKLVLTPTSVKIGDETLAIIRDGEVVGLDPENLVDSNLFQQLRRHREEIDLREKEGSHGNKHMLFLCDKKTRYKTINQVVKTAAKAGFPDFKFAVLGKE